MRFLPALFFMTGCLGHTRPWVWEQPIHDIQVSLNDGPPDSVVLHVHNPTDKDLTLHVRCGSTVVSHWEVDVPAGQVVQGIAWLMARDIGASTCEVE